MRDLLLVLNPRRLPECLAAIRDLPIDKLWVTGFTERQIAETWQEILKQADGYYRMIVTSDDACPRPHALSSVQTLLDDGHPVATGYVNLDRTAQYVNLTETPIADGQIDPMTLGDALEHTEPGFPTFFAGFALTGCPLSLWHDYPFACVGDPGFGSDMSFCERLQRDNVPIMAAREGFYWHAKDRWNHMDAAPARGLRIGGSDAGIRLERWDDA